jgi:hypothetical protein
MPQQYYVIAIPSYKRAETLRDKTLALLSRYNIDPSIIHIFVASAAEAAHYTATLIPGTYGKIIIGVLKIGPQRNFIMNYFPPRAPLVQIDDDLTALIEYDQTVARHERPLRDLDSAIQRGFRLCKENRCNYWGIYPIANGFFMKPGHTTDLRFIIGVMTGCFNPGPSLNVHLESFKEDYERTIKFYERDGAVIRMNDIAPKTSYYTEKGGAQEFRNSTAMEEEARWLAETYPTLCRIRWVKKKWYSADRLYPVVTLKDGTKTPP